MGQEVFATRQGLSEETIGYCHELKIEALAGLGELLKKTPKRTTQHSRGGGSKGSKREPLPDAPPTLAEMGVDKKTSSLAQRLAALSGTERNAVASGDKTLAAVQREKTAAVRKKRLALPDAKYRVVYADPPWQYRDKAETGAVQAGGAGEERGRDTGYQEGTPCRCSPDNSQLWHRQEDRERGSEAGRTGPDRRGWPRSDERGVSKGLKVGDWGTAPVGRAEMPAHPLAAGRAAGSNLYIPIQASTLLRRTEQQHFSTGKPTVKAVLMSGFVRFRWGAA